MVCRSPSGRRRSGKRSRRGISVMGHDLLGSGSLLIRSPRWAGRRRPRSPTWTIQPEDTAETGQLLRESHARQRDRNHPDQPVPDQPPPRLTNRFGAAVGDSIGVEVGQHLGLPGLQRSAEPGDLGDRTGGEAGDHLLRNLAAAGCGGVVDRAELLVALPGQVDLSDWVAFLQAAGELGLLLLGEVLHAVAKQSADLVERVVLVAAMTKRVLLDTATDLVDDLGAEANDMEGVEYRDRVGQLVAD